MSAETAMHILYAITFVALIVWISGLRFLIVSAKAAGRAPRDPEKLPEFGNDLPSNMVAGSAEIEGRPAELASKAAAALAGGSLSVLGQFRILGRTDDSVTFEASGPNPTQSKSAAQVVRRGELRFTQARGNRTVVDYAIEIAGGRGLLIGGAIFQVLGLVAIVAGFLLILTLVVPNQQPAVRGQTFQMCQVIHLLWPPFLFGGLYRQRHRVVRGSLDTFVHNLPYAEG